MDTLRRLIVIILASVILVETLDVETQDYYNDTDQCNLSHHLVKEIAAYRKLTKRAMEEITLGGLGDIVYDEYVKFITKFGARPSGSNRLERAIDYMVNLTKNFDVHNVITEEVKVPHWVRKKEIAVMLRPRFQKLAVLGSGSSVSTPHRGITAQAIVINSFDELNITDPDKIKGKIVVYDPHFTTYGQTVKYRSKGASKAAKKGAVATLVRSITPFSIYSLHTGQQQYEENVTKIPTASITHEDADLLRRLQLAGHIIILHLNLHYKSDMKKSRNTLVDLKGSLYPKQMVIVSGHIDSWDVGEGAMDDGGGMMISWFVPVVLKMQLLQPKRTVRAILWTAEEPGLFGAEAYLKKHRSKLSNIIFVMEADDGTFKPLGLDVAGEQKTRCIVNEVLKLFTPINKVTYSETPGSDIMVFIRKGIPGASLLTKRKRYYWYHHSRGDVLSLQNKDDLIECAAFWTMFSYVIADLSVNISDNDA